MKTLKSFFRLILPLALLFSTLGGAFTASPAQAASIVVNSNTDIDADDGTCTLREAIHAAEIDAMWWPSPGECAAGSGADTITFAGDYTITLDARLEIDTAITINGNGIGKTIVQSSTCNPVVLPGSCTPASYRVFHINPTGNLTLDGLTVQYGYDGYGGGIQNNGTLSVKNSHVTGNKSSTSGGGIYTSGSASTSITDSQVTGNYSVYDGGGMDVAGTLDIANSSISSNITASGSSGGGIHSTGTVTITDSTFWGNYSYYDGGGIYNAGSGILVITNSTFKYNDAGFGSGGGAYNSGVLTLANSTFAGNTAAGAGGGIANDGGSTYIMQGTFSGNSADYDGGGVSAQASGGITLNNTIIANSASGGDCFASSSSISADWHNLDTDGSCDGATQKTSAQIKLAPLADNGGPTETMALLGGSHAIDAGDDAVCIASPVDNLDQRGVTRPYGAHCDVGAYELKKFTKTFQSQSANDGWILENSENGSAGGTMNKDAATLRLGDNAARKQYRSILSFNTASLPDNAVITKVTLKVKQQGITGGGNPFFDFQGFMADFKKGSFGTSSLQLADFQTTAQKAVESINPIISGGWYRLNLTNAKAYINKLTTNGGLTQIRLRFKLGDDNNGAANYLSLYSGNAGAASRPQLIVEYYVP